MSSFTPECTPKCKSRCHADLAIASVIVNASSEEIASYLISLCCNFANLRDDFGRTILHMCASRPNRHKLLTWLIEKYKVDVNKKDWESGWTALHRSLFYGEITSARKLIQNGSSLSVMDRNGMSPFDLLMKDNKALANNAGSAATEIYVWGSNTNFNLGEQEQQNRQHPNLMEYFRKKDISIVKVVLNKFHSVFLSDDGKVFTCGHGQGGRLGLGSELTCLTPCCIRLSSHRSANKLACVERIAAGDDHTVILTETGEIYSFGMNNFHQLGHTPPPEKLLKPKKINNNILKRVKSIHCSSFHTVICTQNGIYSCGLNAGQLGHSKGARTQVTFRKISRLNRENINITHASVSNGATVCVTDDRNIYAFHEYKCKKLLSFSNVKKIQVVGGYLDVSCDPIKLNKGGSDFKILVLSTEGNIYLCTSGQLIRCLFTYGRQPFVTDVALSISNLLVVTDDKEGFVGTLSQLPEPKQKKQIVSFLERNECYQIKLRRLMFVHRATRAFCDMKGRTYAVIQEHPACRLYFKPAVEETDTNERYKLLRVETDCGNGLHDIVIEVDGVQFPAHKFILSSQSSYFGDKLTDDILLVNEFPSIKLTNVSKQLFESMLGYLYSGDDGDLLAIHLTTQCSSPKEDVCRCFDDVNYSNISAFEMNKKKQNCCKCKQGVRCKPIVSPLELAKMLGISKLISRLQSYRSQPENLNRDVCLKFKQSKMFSDVAIKSADGGEFACHKCILMTRSDYFKGMFTSCWLESTATNTVQLQVSSDVLKVLLDYIYEDTFTFSSGTTLLTSRRSFPLYATDASTRSMGHFKSYLAVIKINECVLRNIPGTKDVELLCGVLAASDHFLLERLKQLCELALSELVTLKNVAEILNFSMMYNAEQLANYCQQFICLNLATIFEMKTLDVLDDDVMEEISATYKTMTPMMCNRIITPYSHGPTSDKIIDVAVKRPVSLEDGDVVSSSRGVNKSNSSISRSRRKSQSQKHTSVCRESRNRNGSTSSDVNPFVFANNVKIKDVNIDKESFGECIENEDVVDRTTPKSPEQDVDFPILGNDIFSSPDSKTIPEIKSGRKIATKLSQKQKKKLMATKIKDEYDAKIILDEDIMTSLHAWQKNPVHVDSPSATSMKEIIQSEERSRWKQHERRPKSFSRSTSHVKKWSYLSSGQKSADDKESDTKSDTSQVGHAPGAWETRSGNVASPPASVSRNLSFSEIMECEEKETAQLKKIQSKPLHLIQTEDQAIEELKLFYNARDNPDEWITVERQVMHSASKPVWKK